MKKSLNSKKITSRRSPRGLGMSDPRQVETIPAPVEASADKPAKAKKTRTVDYTRTDKRPHSFRYKRHTQFVPRSGPLALAKDTDGALIIGQTKEAVEGETVKLDAGVLELVSVKKRPNGKTAITFKHNELGEVVCYDARDARAALRQN